MDNEKEIDEISKIHHRRVAQAENLLFLLGLKSDSSNSDEEKEMEFSR